MSSSPTPPENRVPPSGVVLLTSLMVLMFSGLTVWTFQGDWFWWSIPAVAAVVAAVILVQRNQARLERKAAREGSR